MPRPTHVLLALALGAGATAPPADAGGRDKGSIVACSRFGNGCYRAPVRQGKWGAEMRLKGGTWIDCRGDCRETLREETVDFWETQNDKAIAAGP
jgi:hypothetical protein